MALWSRDRDGIALAEGMVSHSDAGRQYTSFAFTTRLIEAGVDPSVRSVGDAYDNALAETTIGLYKTEKINRRRPLAHPGRRRDRDPRMDSTATTTSACTPRATGGLRPSM